MKKIESLTSEQESLMLKIRDKWINQLYELKPVNKEQIEAGINWLYSFCKIPNPKIIYCQSILEAQLVIHFLKQLEKANVGDNVWDNVGANVWANVRANVWWY